MLTDEIVVRVGMEIEVAAWRKRTYQDATKELLKAGYMLGDEKLWREYHRYGCVCDPGGCKQVRSGHVIDPPLVSLTYDASLPVTGAEFVTSTIVLGPHGMDVLRPIWDMVVDDAVWTDKLKDKNGGWASPSVHLHVSAETGKKMKSTGAGYIDGNGNPVGGTDDCMHVLSLFGPEFIALASAAGYKRGLTYRKPTRYPDGPRAHHGFIHVRAFIPGVKVYIEWRMFEAAYDNWEYVEAATFLSATLTRALLKPGSLSGLMAAGYASPYDGGDMNNALRENNTEAVLKMVNPRRLTYLREFCVAELPDDERGIKLLATLFDKTEAMYG